MKLRIVEYRYGMWRRFMGFGPDVTEVEEGDLLTQFDPHPSEGWVHISADGDPLSARSRMFFDVDSVSGPSEPEVYDEERVPGRSFEIHFDSGESLTVHNTIIAESEAEVAPVS